MKKLGIILAFLSLIACRQINENKVQKSTNQVDEYQNVKYQEIIVNDEVLNAVYHQYMQLNQSLIGENLLYSTEAAVNIENGITQQNKYPQLAGLIHHIASAKTVEAQRQFFAPFSQALMKAIKKVGLKSGKIYVNHCPMVDDDKGAYWLSNMKEIRNPYYGQKMMDCGKVEEEIN